MSQSEQTVDRATDLANPDRAALLADLARVLPAEALLFADEDLKPYECDGLTAYRCLPWAVVLPQNEQQVVAALKVCHARQVPVVARGAGTGLSGGATPVVQGVVLSLARFMRILEIDPLARLARVQPGVRNLAISEAAAPHGLYYAPDPSSQIACSIGGNIAENAGGVHCLKYGLTLHNVLKLRVALMNGEVIEIGSHALDEPGYDLLALMIGSEGMLGVVLEATVKLTPKPRTAQVVMASFDSVIDAGNAVAAIIAAGIIPAGLEMMDKLATAAVEDFVHAGYDLSAAAILLAESDGTAEEVAEEIATMSTLLEESGARELRISQSEAERLKFWAGRKAAFPAVGRITPDYLCMDGTIPRKHLSHVLTRIAELSAEFYLRCANVFHAGMATCTR
jgi:glycolate oxidase